MLKVDPAMADPEVTLEYLCDNIWIVGSPDTVATKLATSFRAQSCYRALP